MSNHTLRRYVWKAADVLNLSKHIDKGRAEKWSGKRHAKVRGVAHPTKVLEEKEVVALSDLVCKHCSGMLFVPVLILSPCTRPHSFSRTVIYSPINTILPATCEEAATAFNLQHTSLYTPAVPGISNKSDNTPTAARWLLLVDTSNWVGVLVKQAIYDMTQDPSWESFKELIASDGSKDGMREALAQTRLDIHLEALKETAIEEMRQKHVDRMCSGFPGSAQALR